MAQSSDEQDARDVRDLVRQQQHMYRRSGLSAGSLGAQGYAYSQSPNNVTPHASEALQDDVKRLTAEVARLKVIIHEEAERYAHMQALYFASQQRQSTDLDKHLKALIALAHPDKWPGNPLAHAITVALNQVRETLS